MHDSEFIEVAHIRNDTNVDVCIHLEMVGDQVVLSPGHEIDLLTRLSRNLHPLSLVCVEGGLQVYAFREPDPSWYFRFEGCIYSAGSPEPTRLAQLKTKGSR